MATNDIVINTIFRGMLSLTKYLFTIHFPKSLIPLDINDVIAALRPISSKSENLALTYVSDLRNLYAHNKISEFNVDNIRDACGIISSWITKHTLIDNEYKILVDTIFILCRNYMILSNDLINENKTQKEFKEQTQKEFKEQTQKEFKEEFKDQITSQDIKTLTSGNFTKEGTFETLKLEGYREQLRGRKIMMLEGKHIHRIATFCSWAGTVVKVKFDGETKKVCISLNKKIGIFRKNK